MSNSLGNLFPENIIKAGKMNRTFGQSSRNGQDTSPVIIFTVILIVGCSILFFRLFDLTIVQGVKYRELSKGNRIRENTILAPRGIIYDRHKNPLVRNIPLYGLDKKDILTEKPDVGQIDPESSSREYIYGSAFSQVIGFIGEVSPQDSGKFNPKDIIGKMGIEKTFDDILRGQNGKELIEVDAIGNRIRTLGRIEPQVGKNITLMLDKELQLKVAEFFGQHSGSVVVSDPQTGGIYALYSSPTFDPNRIIRNERLAEIFEDEKKPLFNRSISGLYPPGSTFKIITSIAVLESGVMNKDTFVEDTGIIEVGDYSYSNWYFSQYGKKEGFLNIVSAIRRSNDIFFYRAGERLGIDTLVDFARKMGTGKRLGIDLEGEAEGLMPDLAWREKYKNEKWYLGDTYITAIGQGDVLSTPLQVNGWTNVVASGGKLCRPHLLANTLAVCDDLRIKKENIELVKEGMKQACSPGGTGWPLFKFKAENEELKVDNVDFFEAEASESAKNWVEIPVACKTGTAEFGDPKGKTHAWFTVFAPVYNPQISLTVLVEEGGEGSSVAGPIAKKILEYWFTNET